MQRRRTACRARVGLSIALAMTLVITAPGCATISRSAHEFVQFQTNPSGAEVYVDGEHVGTTPVSAPLSRNSGHSVELRKAGYDSQTVEVERKFDWITVLGNLVFFYGLGAFVDLATGRSFSMDLEDSRLSVAMVRDPSQPVPGPASPDPRFVARASGTGEAGAVDFASVAPLPEAGTTSLPRNAFGRYHALVIGNARYTRLQPLVTATADARAVARLLQAEYDMSVTLLIDATRRDIIDALDGLRARLDSTDNLLIYYAGHGFLDEESERGYWLPVDADPELTANWLSNATLTDTLKAVRAKHVMVVADSCYSGTLTRGIKMGPRAPADLARMAKKRTRVVLSSGGLEPVTDSGGGLHSIFAKSFLDALSANRGVIDGTQLYVAIRRPVMVTAPQTPRYSDLRFAGHEGGDFLFVRGRK